MYYLMEQACLLQTLQAPYNTLSFAKLGDAAASSYFNIIQADNNNIDIVLAQSLINSGRDVYTVGRDGS